MALKVKICGLSEAASVEAAVTGGASHVGFIFFPKSPRNVTVDQAATLRALVADRAVPVAVTVDADDAALDEIVATVRPGLLQLHGSESPERATAVKARYGLPVMKALPVSQPSDLDRIKAYRGIADAFLFDAKPPPGSKLPGGNGVSFDWNLLAGIDPGIDYMLSGGLDEFNVATALRMANPPGIDVSSGVESAPGIKDPARIARFFDAMRAAAAGRAA